MKRKYLYIIAFFLFSCKQVLIPDDVIGIMPGIPTEIDYNLHVKQILSDKCFTCHGPDTKKQKAGLRLDLSSAALSKVTESGLKAINPGKISQSEMVYRILSDDPEYRMPEPSSHLTLTAYEKAVLVKWIEQGAKYKPHWAFVVPKKEKVPTVKNNAWCKNDIDKFILNKIEETNLAPAPQADKETLIRRLSFDIRGFSPSVKEIDAFLQSKDPNAYEKLVDGFLASPHYGERMAIHWLDVARFADSYGYLDDKHYNMSPWRDWVIQAYNKNLSFKDFITWQLAGDLLPNATQEQILATGFNRNHKQNTEAGIIEEEFRVENVVDRTNTLGTAIMAMTVGCAKCHDHKYDPISQKEYYSLYSFFNSTFENGGPNYGNEDMVPGPTLLLTQKESDLKIKELKNYISRLETEQKKKEITLEDELKSTGETAIKNALSKKRVAYVNFDEISTQVDKKQFYKNVVNPALNASAKKTEIGKGIRGNSLKYNDETFVAFPTYKLGYFERYQPFSFSIWLKVPANYPLATVFYQSDYRRYGYQGYDLLLKDNRINFRLSHSFPHDAISVLSKQKLDSDRWYHIAISYDGSSKANGLMLFLDGKKIALDIEYDHLVKHIRSYPNIHKASPFQGLDFGYRELDRSMPGGEIDEFQLFNDQLSASEIGYLFSGKPIPFSKLKDSTGSILMSARKELCNLYDSTQEVMVMGDLPVSRPTFVLKRGLYDSYGDQVYPSTPKAILPFPKELPRNRLGLATWLFSDQQPLTGRVAVNRLWQLVFGQGLVKSSDNFGNQGDMPSHPALLDYLSIYYREHNWDTKNVLKMIFMSATYQQSSVNTPEILKKDPNNQLLTRSPRYRFPAEMIRDNALYISNLLSSKTGGPSVYPYQPEGLWDELSEKKWSYKYIPSTGEDGYRKSIYTIRKRTSVVPFMQIFDAPDRSVCTVKRQVSSSPMQSLALLNDPQMVEAARCLASEAMQEGGKNRNEQFEYCFRSITGRRPDRRELELMKNLYAAESKNFSTHPEKAKKLLLVGNKMVKTQDESSLASFATVALALMNTDEFFTRK